MLTTDERMVVQAASVILIANLAALVAWGAMPEWRQLAINVALLEITLITLVLVVPVCLQAAYRRLHGSSPRAVFRIAIADGHLRMYEPGRHGTQLVDADLTSVRHIHWYLSAFSRTQTVRITLWDRPSTFTLQGLDVLPDDPVARELGWFRGPDLLLQADQHRRFVEHFEPLVLSGQVTSTIDLQTLQPIQLDADHTAAGWIAFEDKLIYSPHVAETERRMRSE